MPHLLQPFLLSSVLLVSLLSAEAGSDGSGLSSPMSNGIGPAFCVALITSYS